MTFSYKKQPMRTFFNSGTSFRGPGVLFVAPPMRLARQFVSPRLHDLTRILRPRTPIEPTIEERHRFAQSCEARADAFPAETPATPHHRFVAAS
jgi:hypothetical protein